MNNSPQLLKFTPSRIILVIAVVVSVLFALLPTTDTIGQSHVDTAFKRALVGYALARGLNGVISVAQGTEVAIQPAGVGVNFTPGQILDPVNDLVERFSWIMMLASSSLGIQKVLLSMSAWNGLLIAVVITGLLLLLSLSLRKLGGVRWILQRLFLFILLLRFMMPVFIVANDWMYRTFLEGDYVEAAASLEQAQRSIGEINEEVQAVRTSEPSTLLERAKAVYDSALANVDIDKRLEEYRLAAESISENTIKLIVVFLMQTLVFPLLFMFILLGVMRRLTRQ
ncbi:MAG: hypothetical protein ACI8VW_001972 [bacterium]|jgi:hypothetical protein